MKFSIRAALTAFLLAPTLAAAQPFPNKPIRMVVPYPAGGTADLMARAIQEPLRQALGQPIIIDNKSGAGGALAARDVAKAAPDGHTLFFSNASIQAVTPQVVKGAGFDGVKDFTPVALVSSAHLLVVVNAGVPVSDLKSFIDFARKQARPLPYASAGIGSFGHLSTELFAKRAGIKMVHVPYRGQAQTTNAVVAGEVPLLITTASGAMSDFIAAGRLKLLAVTSALPSPLAPTVPTVASVLPGYAAESWFGILAPAGTPGPVVQKLNGAINAALAAPDIQQRFAAFGMEVRTGMPDRLGELMVLDAARWAPVIRESNIQPE